MGRAVAWDLIKQDDVEEVGLVGRRQEALAEVRELIESTKIAIHALNVEDRDSLLRLKEGRLRRIPSMN
jgi:NADP-dependent 3-hydroxy acid dehydrogenase YdfG